MKISTIRDILVLLTSIVSFIIIYFKILSSFFIETIKVKYKNGPCKESVFSIIIRGSTIVFIFIYIVCFGITMYNMIVNRVNIKEITLNTNGLVGGMSVLLLGGIFGATFNNFLELKSVFICKLEDNLKSTIKKKYEITNFISMIISMSFGVVVFWGLLCELWKIASLLITSAEEKIPQEEISSLMNNIIIWLFLFGIFVICLSLQEIIKDVYSDFTYWIVTDEDTYIS
ncbi:hypothetical protein, partial [Clostridium saccharoperbutylacetonicum]|uniref:hypothetical protein n=1 Tax=Clostridium saccharoperbutylacetonicum TaxID=36745 RepID=UPI0039E737ED